MGICSDLFWATHTRRDRAAERQAANHRSDHTIHAPEAGYCALTLELFVICVYWEGGIDRNVSESTQRLGPSIAHPGPASNGDPSTHPPWTCCGTRRKPSEQPGTQRIWMVRVAEGVDGSASPQGCPSITPSGRGSARCPVRTVISNTPQGGQSHLQGRHAWAFFGPPSASAASTAGAAVPPGAIASTGWWAGSNTSALLIRPVACCPAMSVVANTGRARSGPPAPQRLSVFRGGTDVDRVVSESGPSSTLYIDSTP